MARRPFFDFCSPPPPPINVYLSPPPRHNNKGHAIFSSLAGLAPVLVILVICGLCYRYRRSRAAAAAMPRAEGHDERGDHGHPRASGAACPPPAFAYSRSVNNNITGGEEAAGCSVCLGAVQPGEPARLLPACMHLYHAECIDQWLAAHSTCPLCRSETDTP